MRSLPNAGLLPLLPLLGPAHGVALDPLPAPSPAPAALELGLDGDLTAFNAGAGAVTSLALLLSVARLSTRTA